MPAKKKVLTQIPKIKAYGELEYIELTIDNQTYKMRFDDCMDTIDNLREANDQHIKKRSIQMQKDKELEQANAPLRRGIFKK